jgi:peptidoglycan/LPS O-acetylase OafA/YrhL
MNRVYFPNLNGLRFIAAFLVIIHHAEQVRFFFKQDNYWTVPFVRNIGQLGVILFFVLSGFLITFLLLKEKNEHGTIFVKDFYIRRILRIWPLYYFIVILSFFILPHFKILSIPGFEGIANADFLQILLLFILFLPNVALAGYAPVSFASQAWSVGVEEQFYLIWPLIIKKSKNTLLLLCIVIFLSVLIGFIVANTAGEQGLMRNVHRFWEHFNIDCMAIGGIAAWVLFHKKEKILNIVFNKYFQAIVLVFTLFCLGTGYYFPVFLKGLDINCECYAVLFAIIILNMASNEASIITLENKFFNYMGKISYGLYMYHVLVIVIVEKVVMPFFNGNTIVFYVSILFLITAVSSCSYEFIEKRFIKRKIKYSKILSGSNAEK